MSCGGWGFQFYQITDDDSEIEQNVAQEVSKKLSLNINDVSDLFSSCESKMVTSSLDSGGVVGPCATRACWENRNESAGFPRLSNAKTRQGTCRRANQV